jgi:hypothetical protein
MKKLLLPAGMIFCLSLAAATRAADEGMQPNDAMKHDHGKSMSAGKMQPGDEMQSGKMMKAPSKMKSKMKAMKGD